MILFYHILRILYMIYWTLFKAFMFDMKHQESLNEVFIYNEKNHNSKVILKLIFKITLSRLDFDFENS